jgi:glycosyltransferase involved in cell wall biosynthesis
MLMSGVDVVIPCYNYARFLPQCVASALNQEGVDVRVLVIDDCSSDDSEAVGMGLAEQDSRVEFRRHPKNRGHIATYNEGLLEWASSEYCVLLSADDGLAPGALARAADLMDRHFEVVMTCGMARTVWGEECLPIGGETSYAEHRILSGSEFLRRCFEIGNPVCTPTAVVRTGLQHRLGGYRADLPHSGDMEMWMRFAVHGSVGVVHSVQAYYRRHEKNMSLNYGSQMLGDRREVLHACEQILDQWGAQFQESDQWREMMLRRLSKESCWLASSAFDGGDSEAFRTCIDFAEEIYPGIRNSRVWKKLRVKGFFGQTLWQGMLPVWESLRKLREGFSGQEVPVVSQQEQLDGWWPGSLED